MVSIAQPNDIIRDIRIGCRETILADDRSAIQNIVASTNMFNDEEKAIAVELFDERQLKGEGSGYNFLFALFNGKVAGYTCFGPIPGTQKRFEIYWIAVHKEYQRTGIGKVLIRKTEESIVGKGGKRSYIETSSRVEYEPTHRFYLSNGYTSIAELLDYYRDGDGKIIFMKNLVGRGESLIRASVLGASGGMTVYSTAG